MATSKKTPDGDIDSTCRRVIDQLTEKQKKIAAYASYQYFIKAELPDNVLSTNDTSTADFDNGFDNALNTTVRWFVEAEHGKEARALARLERVLAWRDEIEMDDLRKLFDPRFEAPKGKEEHYAYLKQGMLDEMEAGKAYTCGYDKDGRCYVLFHMDEYFRFEPEFHYRFSFWIVERALAATQRKTNGQVQGMNFVMSYKNYTMKNMIPLGMVKQTIYMGLTYYPELIHKIYLLDTPFIFRAVWTMIQPFLDASTKSKITFVTGDEAKREKIGPHIAAEEAALCLLPEGENPGRPPLDLKVYMEGTPFDRVFSEIED